jgi:hypothetical protein
VDANTDRAHVRLAELVAALSLGVDLGFGQPMEHVLRQCLIAPRLAERAGLDEQQRAVVYYAALLVNVGCHTDAHEQTKWFGDDIAPADEVRALDAHRLDERDRVLGHDLVGDPAGNVGRPAMRAPLGQIHPEVLGERRRLGIKRLRRAHPAVQQGTRPVSMCSPFLVELVAMLPPVGYGHPTVAPQPGHRASAVSSPVR